MSRIKDQLQNLGMRTDKRHLPIGSQEWHDDVDRTNWLNTHYVTVPNPDPKGPDDHWMLEKISDP